MARNDFVHGIILASSILALGYSSGSAQTSGVAGAVEEEASAQQIFDEFVGGTLTNCFFKYGPTGADPLNNRAFPDAGAIYWAATFVRPELLRV